MWKHLKWLWGSAGAALLIALGTNEGLKALHNHAEATALDHSTRGGIFGLVAGASLAVLGTPKAKQSVSGWREKLFSAARKK